MSLKKGDNVRILSYTGSNCEADDIEFGGVYMMANDAEFLDDVGQERNIKCFKYGLVEQRKHSEMIVEWAYGAQIQFYSGNPDVGLEEDKWRDVNGNNPTWGDLETYRVKPVEPVERVEFGGYLYMKSEFEDAIRELEKERIEVAVSVVSDSSDLEDTKEKEFVVGDEVMIAKTSEFYDMNVPWNPTDVVGEITKITSRMDGFDYFVLWPKANDIHDNTYRKEDIVHA